MVAHNDDKYLSRSQSLIEVNNFLEFQLENKKFEFIEFLFQFIHQEKLIV